MRLERDCLAPTPDYSISEPLSAADQKILDDLILRLEIEDADDWYAEECLRMADRAPA